MNKPVYNVTQTFIFVHLKKDFFLIQIMSLASGTVNNPAIDNLVQSSYVDKYKYYTLEWIPQSQITDIEPTQIDNVYYAIRKQILNGNFYETTIMLLLLGSSEECTPTLVSEFARIYSLPILKYNNDVSQYRRYSNGLRNATNS